MHRISQKYYPYSYIITGINSKPVLEQPGRERDNDFFSLKQPERAVEPPRDALKLK